MINIVYNEDCRPAMREMKDNQFDLAIVDPPYGIGDVVSSLGAKHHKKITWDKDIPNAEYFIELQRVSIHQIIWGINYFFKYAYNSGRIIWNKLGVDIKRRKPPSSSSDVEIASHSFGILNKMYSYTWIGNVKGNDYQIDWDNSKEPRIHPTQKPIALYKWLLKNYAKTTKCLECQGAGEMAKPPYDDSDICPYCSGMGSHKDTILDTHVGSGSSRIACYEMGFDFTGYEIDVDYWQAQEKRFNIVKNQMRLFTDGKT